MCQFLSAIVLRNGDVLTHEATDGHSYLVQHFQLPDDRETRHFAKVEFTPGKSPENGRPNYADPDSYTLTVDEDTEPIWFDDVRERVEAQLRAAIKRMIVRDRRNLLLGGHWILADGAEVADVVAARIIAMVGSARVGFMYDSARVGTMYDSARVGFMYNSALVGTMYDSARVGSMYDSAWVGNMRDSARVADMYGSAQVGGMYGSAQVGTMRGSAQVGGMYGSAQVGTMYNSARVGVMHGSAQVGSMYGSAQVGSKPA